MTISQRVINDLKADIDSKTAQRKSILSQLSLLDVQIDGYDTLIINMDAEAIQLISPMNESITGVKSSYDFVISSGCKTDLAWIEVDRWTQQVQGGAGDGSAIYDVEFIKYEVQRNPAAKIETPYYGLKYYRKPSNRDYGSFIIANFTGNLSSGSSSIAVLDEEGISSLIQVGDFITDSIDSPQIFDASNLPTVVGFGTTQSVGVSTALIGGIENGSNSFAHFGSGSLVGVETGMFLINPDVLQENTVITGFGVTEVNIDYFTGGGILTSGILTCTSILLDKSAIDTTTESVFNVGIVTVSPGIFISTVADSNDEFVQFTVFRAGDLNDIDKDFDPLLDPNTPLKIGIIDNSTLGFGHSITYDNSGSPSQLQSYNPNKAYVDTSRETEQRCLFNKNGTPRSNSAWDPVNNQCIKNPEPPVGAGMAVYYEGSDNWPVIRTPTVSNGTIIGYTETYANLGDTLTVSSSTGITTGANIGYVLYGPSGQCSSGQLNSLASAISTSESNSQNLINQNSIKASNVAENSKALRRQRAEKELYAWSLLQASSSLRREIDLLTQEYNKLVSVDLTIYE